MARKKQRKPKIKTESTAFQKAFAAGTLPKGSAAVKTILKYSSKRTGKPLKRELRSRKAREEYNKALLEYNRQRPTAEKEKKRRAAIREKQRETVRRTSLPEAAERAVYDYDKMIDIMETVKDTINATIKYEDVKALLNENPNLTADDIAGFIVKKYKDIQSSLPSFAAKDTTDADRYMDMIAQVMTETNTSEVATLEKALQKKAQSPRAYQSFIRELKKKQRRQGRRK